MCIGKGAPIPRPSSSGHFQRPRILSHPRMDPSSSLVFPDLRIHSGPGLLNLSPTQASTSQGKCLIFVLKCQLDYAKCRGGIHPSCSLWACRKAGLHCRLLCPRESSRLAMQPSAVTGQVTHHQLLSCTSMPMFYAHPRFGSARGLSKYH